MSLKLYISNDNILTLVGLQNSVDAAYLNAATVTVTLVDSDEVDLVGGSWPLTMDYVAASSGDYQGTLLDTITGLTDSDAVTAQITANAGSGLQGYWEVALTATTRTS